MCIFYFCIICLLLFRWRSLVLGVRIPCFRDPLFLRNIEILFRPIKIIQICKISRLLMHPLVLAAFLDANSRRQCSFCGWMALDELPNNQRYDLLSVELEKHIRKLHSITGHANATGKLILYGVMKMDPHSYSMQQHMPFLIVLHHLQLSQPQFLILALVMHFSNMSNNQMAYFWMINNERSCLQISLFIMCKITKCLDVCPNNQTSHA